MKDRLVISRYAVVFFAVATLAGFGCGSGNTTAADEDLGGTGADVTTQDNQVVTGCVDNDNDGHMGTSAECPTGTDCADDNAAVHPGAAELCGNGVDEDCAGGDEVCPEPCEDNDKDGHMGKTPECPTGTDCVDTNDTIHPGATDICGNGQDEDCDGQDLPCPPECKDLDDDGFVGKTADCSQGTDCDDGDNDVHPNAVEICGNDQDDDCDGEDPVCPPECEDNDGDGYGIGSDCTDYDCNDGNPDVHPGAAEVCGNGFDDDCVDGDENCPDVCEDGDGDDFGVGAACPVQDCDDGNADINPAAQEICGNNVDEDCSGAADECVCLDKDGDGYGTGDSCTGPDCDDSNPDVNPGAEEVCGNGLDDDCVDGEEECEIDCTDNDGDGFGIGADCDGIDCDDTKPGVFPGADEVCENGIDDDCDGADADCPPPNCESDVDCVANQLCDQATGTCRYAKVWEWWAPTFYVDTDTAGPGLDHPRKVDFDGDWNSENNETNLPFGSNEAVIYYSFVKTSTHWYLGYYVFFPKRWTTWFGGTEYENTMRAVLMVVEQDGSMYGTPVLMETLTEDTFFQYTPEGSALWSLGTTIDGTINYDYFFPTDHHPVVYVHSKDHGIWGDDYLWNNINNWDVTGFPDGDGIVYRFGGVGDSPAVDSDEVYYRLAAVVDELWPKSTDIGPGMLFDDFGHFGAADSNSYKSLAPWRLYDSNFPTEPEGELLYDPADLVRRHFPDGWGGFSYNYVYNPYAVKVTVKDLQVMVTADPFDGLAEPFVKLFVWDGGGYKITALNSFYGLQNSWYGDEQAVGYVYDLAVEMGGRNYFYGFLFPTDSYFGIEVRDYDGGWSGDDWLMDLEQTHYYLFEGSQFLDWGESNSYVQVDLP